MKQVIGTFYNNSKDNFDLFISIFQNQGYEVAKEYGNYQAVVIDEVPDPEPDQE